VNYAIGMSSFSYVSSSEGFSSGSDRESVGAKENSHNLSHNLSAEERAEKAEENWSLWCGYEWVDFHIREYFS